MACREVLEQHNDENNQYLFWVLLCDWHGGVALQDGKLLLTSGGVFCLSQQEIEQRLVQHPRKNGDVCRIIQGIRDVALNDTQRQHLLNLFYGSLCKKYPRVVNSTQEVGIDIYIDREDRMEFLEEVEDIFGVKLDRDQRQALWDLSGILLHRDAPEDDRFIDNEDPLGY